MAERQVQRATATDGPRCRTQHVLAVVCTERKVEAKTKQDNCLELVCSKTENCPNLFTPKTEAEGREGIPLPSPRAYAGGAFRAPQKYGHFTSLSMQTVGNGRLLNLVLGANYTVKLLFFLFHLAVFGFKKCTYGSHRIRI